MPNDTPGFSIPTVPIGPDLIELIRGAYRLNLPVLIEGGTGIGKTALCEQVCRGLGIDFRLLEAALWERVDLIGLPQRHEGKVRYAVPSFFPDQPALVLMDEINRADKAVRGALLSGLAGCPPRIGDWVVPPGVLLVAAMNGIDDGSHEIAELDVAFEERFLWVRACATPESFLRHARARGMHPAVLELVELYAADIFSAERPNPRSLERASQVLADADAGGLPARLVAIMLHGALKSQVWSDRLQALWQGTTPAERPLTPTQVFEGYDGELRSNFRELLRQGRVDLAQATLDGVLAAIGFHEGFPSARAVANTRMFLRDLPGDLRRMGKKRIAELVGDAIFKGLWTGVGP